MTFNLSDTPSKVHGVAKSSAVIDSGSKLKRYVLARSCRNDDETYSTHWLVKQNYRLARHYRNDLEVTHHDLTKTDFLDLPDKCGF